MERIIDIKLRDLNNSGGLGDLERKICDVFVIDDNQIKRKINLDLGNPKLQGYLKKFEKNLTSRKDVMVEKALENTGKKRIRNNLIASPLYITSFLALALSLMGVPEVIGIPLFLASLGIGISSVALTNMRSLYTKPEDEKAIQILEEKIKECKDLQNEMEKVLDDKQEIKVEVKEVVAPKKENISAISTKDVTLEKEQKIMEENRRIYNTAMETKRVVERKSKFDYPELYSRVAMIEELLKEKPTSRYPNGRIDDVPEYLKKGRR
ncbi:MAG: hypothetical protein IJ501_01700 [Bacilli bacterium]|nr:hypothetical protein [Bacilli bacterium]